jgi:hypothetical protein
MRWGTKILLDWARVVGYGPFSLYLIHKEGLCPSCGDINKLMMMMMTFNVISIIISLLIMMMMTFNVIIIIISLLIRILII